MAVYEMGTKISFVFYQEFIPGFRDDRTEQQKQSPLHICTKYKVPVYFNLFFAYSVVDMLFSRLLIFVRINIFENSFRNTIRVSNSLDPDQAGQNVRPDLGPSCLQKLELEDTRRQGVNHLCQINSSTDIVF